MINKSDVADPMVVTRLQARERHSVVSSARTGNGISDVLAALEADLPRPAVKIEALLPYERGDLLNRIHEYGEVLGIEHTADGTRVRAQVHPGLGGALARFAVARTG